MEMMKEVHNRGAKGKQLARKERGIMVALHALFQTALIFLQYKMNDGTSILNNVV